jgi:hypothetical protein
MNGALLLPAATTTTMMTTTMTAAMTTASTGTLLPTATTGVAHHAATLAFPTMAPRLIQAPPAAAVSCLLFVASRLHAPFQLPAHQLPFLPQYYFPPMIVRPPVWVARKGKPQVASRCCCCCCCCKRYWKYHHVLDKPEGSMGRVPPHCLDCPVRKQRRGPNNGPKSPP